VFDLITCYLNASDILFTTAVLQLSSGALSGKSKYA